METKTAFVTGATGFFGANLVRELITQNWKVIAFYRSTSNLRRLKGLDLELREGSLFDAASLDSALPEHVDAVFHVAARVSFWRGDNSLLQRDNVEATKFLLEAAIRRKTQLFIFTSTAGVYGFSNPLIDEGFPKEGLKSSVGYLRTKAEAELEVLKAVEKGLDAVILNPATIMGPLDDEHWGRSMRQVKEGKMAGAPPGAGSFVHAVEAAKAHVAAFKRGQKGENYILAGTNATYVEVFRAIEEFFELKPTSRPIPKVILKIFAELAQLGSILTRKAPLVTPEILTVLTSHVYCDSRKAIEKLGLQTKSLKEMLSDCWKSLPPASI